MYSKRNPKRTRYAKEDEKSVGRKCENANKTKFQYNEIAVFSCTRRGSREAQFRPPEIILPGGKAGSCPDRAARVALRRHPSDHPTSLTLQHYENNDQRNQETTKRINLLKDIKTLLIGYPILPSNPLTMPTS